MAVSSINNTGKAAVKPAVSGTIRTEAGRRLHIRPDAGAWRLRPEGSFSPVDNALKIEAQLKALAVNPGLNDSERMLVETLANDTTLLAVAITKLNNAGIAITPSEFIDTVLTGLKEIQRLPVDPFLGEIQVTSELVAEYFKVGMMHEIGVRGERMPEGSWDDFLTSYARHLPLRDRLFSEKTGAVPAEQLFFGMKLLNIKSVGKYLDERSTAVPSPMEALITAGSAGLMIEAAVLEKDADAVGRSYSENPELTAAVLKECGAAAAELLLDIAEAPRMLADMANDETAGPGVIPAIVERMKKGNAATEAIVLVDASIGHIASAYDGIELPPYAGLARLPLIRSLAPLELTETLKRKELLLETLLFMLSIPSEAKTKSLFRYLTGKGAEGDLVSDIRFASRVTAYFNEMESALGANMTLMNVHAARMEEVEKLVSGRPDDLLPILTAAALRGSIISARTREALTAKDHDTAFLINADLKDFLSDEGLDHYDTRYVPGFIAASIDRSHFDRSVDELKLAISRDRGKGGVFVALEVVQDILGPEIYTALHKAYKETGRPEHFPEALVYGSLIRVVGNRKKIKDFITALKDDTEIWEGIKGLIDREKYGAVQEIIIAISARVKGVDLPGAIQNARGTVRAIIGDGLLLK